MTTSNFNTASMAALLLMMGCLKTDPTGPANADTSQLQDDDLQAGASSSTNWPTKTGDAGVIWVKATADSTLSLGFNYVSTSVEIGQPPHSTYTPVKVSGKLLIYKIGAVPALDSVPSSSMPFDQKDSLDIPNSLLDPLFDKNRDTLYINLRIETDSTQAWLFGMGYARKSNAFFKTGFSVMTENSIYLRKPDQYFRGRLDTSALVSKPALTGKSSWIFYIPGSPYYWIAGGDSLQLGQLPQATYPLRLLHVTYAASGESGSEADIFEVLSTKLDSTADVDYIFKPGKKISSFTAQGAIALRP